jgi:hypothetical protein
VNEKKIMDFITKNPMTAMVILPAVATFGMVGILGLGMATIDVFI